MARGTQLKRDRHVIIVQRRDISSGITLSCLSHPWLHVHVHVCKGPHWRRDCPLKCRPQGSESQDNLDWRCPGVPTQAPILITPKEPWVLITVGGQSIDFLLDTGATFSVLTEAPGLLSSWSTTLMRLSGWAKCYCFSCPLSCNKDSYAVFSWVSNCARVSLTHFREGYTEKGPSWVWPLFSWIWSLLFLSH